MNEPTRQGVEASERMMQLVQALGPKDLCLVLISGGGSALSPLPVEQISLQQKVALTHLLSASGATKPQTAIEPQRSNEI